MTEEHEYDDEIDIFDGEEGEASFDEDDLEEDDYDDDFGENVNKTDDLEEKTDDF